jgi:hypothetical protein
MSIKIDGALSPNVLILGLVVGAGVYLVWKAGNVSEAIRGYSPGDTFAENWSQAGNVVPFTPMWWTNQIQDAYTALPSEVPAAVNPASDQNIIYQGVNSLVQKLPGASKDETLGTYLYGLFNRN